MKITWFGHSCFSIESSSGIKILTDPFDPNIGYNIPNIKPNIVTISHNHFDHSYIDYIKDCPHIINKHGNFKIEEINITGIPAFHDSAKGMKRGPNIIFVFSIDGFRVCHLGDLGHTLDKDLIDMIGNLDVLFIPVGGSYTLDGIEAAKLCNNLNSHFIIPMHFNTSVLTFPLEGTENFVTKMKSGVRLHNSSLILNSIDSNEHNKVILLDY